MKYETRRATTSLRTFFIAPAKLNSTLIGLAIILFVSNNLIGRIGVFYEKMRSASLFYGEFDGRCRKRALINIIGA